MYNFCVYTCAYAISEARHQMNDKKRKVRSDCEAQLQLKIDDADFYQ